MKVQTTKTCLIGGKRVRAGVVVDITLKKGVKLPRHLVPLDKIEPEPKPIDTLSQLGKASVVSGKDSKTPVI